MLRETVISMLFGDRLRAKNEFKSKQDMNENFEVIAANNSHKVLEVITWNNYFNKKSIHG